MSRRSNFIEMIGVELDENDEQVKLAENVANGILGI